MLNENEQKEVAERLGQVLDRYCGHEVYEGLLEAANKALEAKGGIEVVIRNSYHQYSVSEHLLHPEEHGHPWFNIGFKYAQFDGDGVIKERDEEVLKSLFGDDLSEIRSIKEDFSGNETRYSYTDIEKLIQEKIDVVNQELENNVGFCWFEYELTLPCLNINAYYNPTKEELEKGKNLRFE
jgi:hypothetical protein